MPRVLFVASEAYPLIKTGGLGDVCGSLPPALATLGVDVRLLLPAYRDALARVPQARRIADLHVPESNLTVSLLEATLPGTRTPVWLVDCPPAYDRPGNPYLDPTGHEWGDNAQRYALLARVACRIVDGVAELDWRPDIVHGHDWQAGLVPTLLAQRRTRPATVFTIHNLAYQGVFPYATFSALQLPPALWSMDGVEFHDQLSFMKGGLTFADRITTVSPTYAREIQTAAFGCGLEGLLRHRVAYLRGILNGIDTDEWNPQDDRHLVTGYSAERLADKRANKLALQEQVGLPPAGDTALLGLVGRLVQQKGIDLILDVLPQMLTWPLQVVILGSGEARFEQALRAVATRHPEQLAVRIGYDEHLAHRIEAGADMFLMPSRFEPCGLNQLYSLRYGTVPIVHRVGGLADTVVDSTPTHLAAGSASGVVFDTPTPAALAAAIERALALYREPAVWRALQRTGMRQDFSWRHSAAEYLRLYREILR